MFEPEYRTGFKVLNQEIGIFPTLKVIIPAILKSFRTQYAPPDNADEAEVKKARIKSHFKLLALLYDNLQERYGKGRTNELMQQMLMQGGRDFFRGFAPSGPEGRLTDFTAIYKSFEDNNIVFDVVEESDRRLEIVIRRCLVYEAFEELGLGDLTQWMCDIAFAYFSDYHPRMEYTKDRMIARGADTCHEVFTWKD